MLYDGAAIYLDDGAEIVMVGAAGQARAHLGRRLPVESHDAWARVYREGRLIILADPEADDGGRVGAPAGAAAGQGWRWIGLPLAADGRTFGVLAIESDEPYTDQAVELSLLEAFAGQAAAAVRIAQLYAQAQASAAAAERERLRDLHDAVTQTLFSASIFADMLPVQMGREPAQAMKNLEKLSQLIRSTLAEMRTLLMELRPAALVAGDLQQLVGGLLQAAMARARVQFSYTTHGDAGIALPPEVQVGVYRIVQETLNNVVKHSGATACEVDLWHRPDGVEIAIRDNGRGFDPEAVAPGHMGLAIIRERARAIGAELSIESRPNEGAAMRLVWPGREGERMTTDDRRIRVLIVDDHPMVLDGLQLFISMSAGMECVGQANSGEEAIALCEKLQPDVVLMDLMMPGMGGIAAIQSDSAERHPGVQVLALTSFAQPDLVQQALEAGAIGYVLKNVRSPSWRMRFARPTTVGASWRRRRWRRWCRRPFAATRRRPTN